MWDIDQEAWWSPHHITNSWKDHSMHRRSPEGLLWLTYWGYTYIWCAVGVLHTVSQFSIDVRYPTRRLVVPLSYCKQPDGPFNAPEIIGGAALIVILRLQICLIYCWYPAYHTAFHWSKILNKKLAGPPIISHIAGWYISCTVDHRTGRPSANVSNKKESKCRPTLAGVRIM